MYPIAMFVPPNEGLGSPEVTTPICVFPLGSARSTINAPSRAGAPFSIVNPTRRCGRSFPGEANWGRMMDEPLNLVRSGAASGSRRSLPTIQPNEAMGGV